MSEGKNAPPRSVYSKTGEALVRAPIVLLGLIWCLGGPFDMVDHVRQLADNGANIWDLLKIVSESLSIVVGGMAVIVAMQIEWAFSKFPRLSVLALIGLVLSAIAANPIPLFILGAVAYVTAGALCQPRAEPPPEWLCPHCDYDLRGLEEMGRGLSGTVCPECGLSKAEREAF